MTEKFKLVDLAGKDGSKWKHGYIPENAAAVALKNHKNPGHLSGRGRFSDPDSKEKSKILDKSSGFSLNQNGRTPTSGYMVSLDDKHGGVEHKVRGNVNASDIYQHKKALVTKHEQTHNGQVGSALDDPSNYHGAWKDGDTTYLDVSKNHKSIVSAAKAAKENNQLAIYDVKNGTSIKTEDALKMAAKETLKRKAK